LINISRKIETGSTAGEGRNKWKENTFKENGKKSLGQGFSMALL
jgi:hypothetical protein